MITTTERERELEEEAAKIRRELHEIEKQKIEAAKRELPKYFKSCSPHYFGFESEGCSYTKVVRIEGYELYGDEFECGAEVIKIRLACRLGLTSAGFFGYQESGQEITEAEYNAALDSVKAVVESLRAEGKG